MANNTIKLAVYGLPPVELEQTCSVAVDPGMLLTRLTDGTIAPHNRVDFFTSPKLVAVENIFEGKTISDQYAAWEKVWFIGARPGDVMWMWLAAGEDADIGSILISNLDGTLAVGAAPHLASSIVGTSLENLGVGGLQRIKVEIA